ncbi:MAG: hypothetical protein ACOC8K_02440 [Gemmatimonadota bacterium]
MGDRSDEASGREETSKLSLFDAVGMAVGGIMGGGISEVLRRAGLVLVLVVFSVVEEVEL